MNRFALLIAASLIVGGCNSVAAATPDSQKPAHCLAAIQYTNSWLRQGGKQELMMNGAARSVFVLKKIQASEMSLEAAKADATALIKAYGNDPERMNALAMECLAAQDRDPQFSAQLPALLALVRANPQLAN